MPSRLGKRKDYNLVDDSYDTRVPLHNEDAFRHGIHFKAKYIGTLDVPRPTGRMEIVVAMRRIRYEFKAKSIKKRKVSINVTTEGVKVTLRKKKKKSDWEWDLERMLIMQDPIYRIFYVSHDSHDLKIWSYIARDGASNVFRCNVFKSPKKSLAMRIVRTIGQAFEVCHKLNIGPPLPKKDENSDEKKESKAVTGKDDAQNDVKGTKKDGSSNGAESNRPTDLTTNGVIDVDVQANDIKSDTRLSTIVDQPLALSASEPISILTSVDSKTPLSAHHQMQLMQQKLQQAEQQTQIAVAQVHLLKDQLAAETTARIESQARNHQLLLQNRDLLEQMTKLTAALTEVEAKLSNSSENPSFSLGLSEILVDATTPPSGVGINSFTDMDMTKVSPFVDNSLFENTNTSNRTPELGKQAGTNGRANLDTSTSTITKSSTVSGSASTKSKKSGRKRAESVTSSESSSDDDMDRPVRLATESGTLKNIGTEQTATVTNGITPPVNKLLTKMNMEQTGDTSIWTSGLLTPDRLSAGNSYQQNSLNFEDTTISTTPNESSLEANPGNGFTLSPIFKLGGDSESGSGQSSFHHYSISDPDTPLTFDTPGARQSPIRHSKSMHNNIRDKDPLPPPTSHSSGEMSKLGKGSKNIIKWVKPEEKALEDDDPYLIEKAETSPTEIVTTPRLNPPPRVRRTPSTNLQSEFRPRPDPHMTPKSSSDGVSGNEPSMDTSPCKNSDSDAEIPNKVARFNKNGIPPSQSAFEYGSDPLLSRFDPLLVKSQSFGYSPITSHQDQNIGSENLLVQDLGSTSNPFSQDVSHGSPDRTILSPISDSDFSKSYSFLEQSFHPNTTPFFHSQSDFEKKLRYEPLSKQRASEWRQPPAFSSSQMAERLNSSFHAGDRQDHMGHLPNGSSDRTQLSNYKTYNDLTSSVTPMKKHVTEKPFLPTVQSTNSNNNNNSSVNKNTSVGSIASSLPSNSLVTLESDIGTEDDRSNTFTDLPSVEGNVSLLDDLLITEPSDSGAQLKEEGSGASPTSMSNMGADDFQPYAQLLSPVSLSSKESVSSVIYCDNSLDISSNQSAPLSTAHSSQQ